MKLLRSAFKLNVSKPRALVHIHDYHNDNEIKIFGRRSLTFLYHNLIKIILKNTKIRIRDSYQGCLRIRYYDSKIALELRSIYNAFTKQLGVSVNW